MFRFMAICFMSLCLFSGTALAYEFKQINQLFDKISEKYASNIDFKQLSKTSCDRLSEMDKRVKFYYSDSKIFLYHQDKLINTFVLPKDENPELWKNTISSILSAGLECSDILSLQAQKLENNVLDTMLNCLDNYSRLEQTKYEEYPLDYTLYENILYIKLSAFKKGQVEVLKDIVQRYSSVHGLILDLRNNRGGNFNDAINTADLFLDDAIIAFSQEKNKPQQCYTSHIGDIFAGKPIAILTNEYTASAAELVAAALGEQSRATLIGTKTYGKGTIQNISNIEQKKLYLTSGYFLTPSGRKVNHRGIRPQICTGIHDSCRLSDKSNPKKDITTAVNFIKNHLN